MTQGPEERYPSDGYDNWLKHSKILVDFSPQINADFRRGRMKLLYEEETYLIIGAAMTVHQELGHEFMEAVYQEELEKEFLFRNIPYKREMPVTIYCKNEPLNKYYIADFICYDKIIIELKALSALTTEHQAQILNYLTATRLKLGLLLNFGKPSLEHKRIINEKSADHWRKTLIPKKHVHMLFQLSSAIALCH